MDIITFETGNAFSQFVQNCEVVLGHKIQDSSDWSFAFDEGMSPVEAVDLYWKSAMERLPRPALNERTSED